MKYISLTLVLLLMLGYCATAHALDIDRYRQLPSCVLAEDLSSIEDLERKGWTVSGNPTIKNVRGQRMIDLDGSDNLEANDMFTISEGSVVVWFTPDVVGSRDVIWSLENNNSIDNSVYLQIPNGTDDLAGYLRTGGTLRAAPGIDANFTVGTSYMITATFSPSTGLDIYLNDGTVTASGTTGQSPTVTDLEIGSGEGGVNYSSGKFGNVLVFNRALTAQEISDIYNGVVFDYELYEELYSDCSETNPSNIGWKENSYNGTGTGLTASTDIVRSGGGRWAIETNGTDEKVDFGDIGTIRTIELWVNPATTTEELVLIDTGKDIMINGGTVTYTGVTATNTYVDGADTDTMVADKLQHLVCVLNADVDANNFELANDGTNYGAAKFDELRVYDSALEQIEAEDTYERSK